MKKYNIIKVTGTAELLTAIEHAKKLSEIMGRDFEDYLDDSLLDFLYNGKIKADSETNSIILIEEEEE